MTQEQLRMQMLAGIITESQYKQKLNENESSSIKVKLTDEWKNSQKLYNMPTDEITLDNDQDSYKFIGNPTLTGDANKDVLFFASKEDNNIFITGLKNLKGEYASLTNPTASFTKNQLERYGNPFDQATSVLNGFEAGDTDEKGYFKII